MTDHLGNTRMVVSGQGEVVQRNDYYAFGLAIDAVDRGENKYLFLNRELQPETGYYDLIHRQYDPAKARFDAVDPKPEDGDQESLSTYQYGLNNPILKSDPNGDCPLCDDAKRLLASVKSWWNRPASPLAKEVGKAYMQSMTGRDIAPSTQGGLLISAIGYASQRMAGSVPGSYKIQIPKDNTERSKNFQGNKGVDLTLKYKSNWASSQRQAADIKVNALTEADTYVNKNIIRKGNQRSVFQKASRTILSSEYDADHMVDLQLVGCDESSNLWGLDKSVNRSLGKPIELSIKNLSHGTKINKVTIKDNNDE